MLPTAAQGLQVTRQGAYASSRRCINCQVSLAQVNLSCDLQANHPVRLKRFAARKYARKRSVSVNALLRASRAGRLLAWPLGLSKMLRYSACLRGLPRRRPGRQGLAPFALAELALTSDFFSLTPDFNLPSITAWSFFASVTRSAAIRPDSDSSSPSSQAGFVGLEIQTSFPRTAP
jgi:hypothetical protein